MNIIGILLISSVATIGAYNGNEEIIAPKAIKEAEEQKNITLIYSEKAADINGYIVAKTQDKKIKYTLMLEENYNDSNYNWDDKIIVYQGKKKDLIWLKKIEK